MINFIIYKCFRYSDILLSMLFNLLLASITILSCFLFLFLDVFNSLFTVPLEIEIARVKLALTIPTGAPATVANDAIVKRSDILTKSFAH